MLLATGSADETVRPRNSAALARALSEAGAPVETLVIEGMDHGWIVASLARPFAWRDSRAKDAVLAFLRKNRESGPASSPVQSP
jgi:acetyl esterase/lipase